MQEDGRPLDEVLDALQSARRRDFSYAAGEILGSMCTAPHPVAQEAYRLFLETNLGDPGHFPGTHGLEQAYIDRLLRLAQAPATGTGLFLSGGTESNIVAVAAAVQAWRATHPYGERPNLVIPTTGHFSFEKAARLTGAEVRRAAVDERFRVRPDAVDALIDDDTCLVACIPGNTEFGAIDPVVALAEVTTRRGVPLHVDAALGGFILPFLPVPSRDAEAWDFAVDGVTSITMDPHKMGGSTIPGGVLLVRDAAWLAPVSVETPYVTTESQAGILGTRPGAGAAAAWAVSEHLGRHGYREQAARCLADAAWLREQLDAAGIPQHPTDLNVVLIRCDEPVAIQDRLTDKGWRVNAVPRHGAIRIVVMPHVERATLEAFLPDLTNVLGATPVDETKAVSR